MGAMGIVRSRDMISQTGIACTGEAGQFEFKSSGPTYQLVEGRRGLFSAAPSSLGAFSGTSVTVLDVQQSGKQPSAMRSKV